MSAELDQAAQAVLEQLMIEPTWPVTVTLDRPLEFGDETITALEFRRGRLGDLKGLRLQDEPQFDDLLLIASRMCGKPRAALELVDGNAGAEVLQIAMGFYMRSLAGGKTR